MITNQRTNTYKHTVYRRLYIAIIDQFVIQSEVK
jgi:hypothetical protein